MKILIALSMLLLLAACAPIATKKADPVQPVAEVSADQQLFIKGVEQVTLHQKAEALLLLKKNYPESPWSELANTILVQADQLKRQEQELKQVHQQLAELSANDQNVHMEEQINRCTAEIQNIKKELDTSNKRLEALRELTIELELKEP